MQGSKSNSYDISNRLIYEVPIAEVLEVRMEKHLLDGSVQGVTSSRNGDGYTYGGSEDWE